MRPTLIHFVETKLALAAVLLGLLCGGVTYELYVQLDASQSTAEALLQANVRARHLTEALSTLQDAEIGQRGFLLTGRADYLEPYDRALKLANINCVKLRTDYADAGLATAAVTSITAKAHAMLAELRGSVEVRRRDGLEAAVKVMLQGTSKRVMDEIRDEVRRLLETEQATIDRNVLHGQSATERNVKLSLGVTCVAVVPLAFCLLLAIRDARRGRRESTHLAHESSHDALTGLLNRSALLTHLDRALGQRPEAVGLLYLDLNGFKPINDELGHAMGDRVLVEVSNRLRTTVHPGDAVARIGGDEFVIVADGCPGRAVLDSLAARVEAVMRDISLPELKGRRIDASVGTAFSAENGAGASSLIAAADAAMYARKVLMKHSSPAQPKLRLVSMPA